MSRDYEPALEQSLAPVHVRRSESPSAFLQAGNQAVAALMVQRQQVGPKAPVQMPGKAGVFQAFIDEGGPFKLTMYALTDDIVGHAWVGVTRGDGQTKTVGFWPISVLGGIVGPGALLTDDPHTGEQTHAYTEDVADLAQMYRILSVIQDWQDTYYSMVIKNCADFVVAVWHTVLGKSVLPSVAGDEGIGMWSPAMVGLGVDARNKQKAELDKAKGAKN